MGIAPRKLIIDSAKPLSLLQEVCRALGRQTGHDENRGTHHKHSPRLVGVFILAEVLVVCAPMAKRLACRSMTLTVNVHQHGGRRKRNYNKQEKRASFKRGELACSDSS